MTHHRNSDELKPEQDDQDEFRRAQIKFLVAVNRLLDSADQVRLDRDRLMALVSGESQGECDGS